MKHFIVCLFSLFSFSSIFGQHSNIDLCEVYRHSLRNNNFDTINYLLELDTSLVTNYEKSEMLSMRAFLHLYYNGEEIDKEATFQHPALQEAQKDFTLAIDKNEDQNDKLKYHFRRFITLKDYEPKYEEFDSDLILLKSKGYKDDKFGLAIAATSKYDGDFWLGLELSFVSGYDPPYTLKDDNQLTIFQRKFSSSGSALILGYSRNVESNRSDVNFTLLRLETPLFVDVTQFGFIRAFDSTHWYYRPEIGIGYSIVHLSAGYTIFFKGHKSRELPNSVFNFRIKHYF